MGGKKYRDRNTKIIFYLVSFDNNVMSYDVVPELKINLFGRVVKFHFKNHDVVLRNNIFKTQY